MSEGESYFDIVWQQFQKNRPAFASLWIIGALFLLAICAPLLASNLPLVFHDGDKTQYPWFRALFYQEEAVDFIFNMALLGLIPWIVLALATNAAAKRRGRSGRRRLALVTIEFLLIVAGLSIFLSADRWPYYATVHTWANPLNAENPWGTRLLAVALPIVTGGCVGFVLAWRRELSAHGRWIAIGFLAPTAPLCRCWPDCCGFPICGLGICMASAILPRKSSRIRKPNTACMRPSRLVLSRWISDPVSSRRASRWLARNPPKARRCTFQIGLRMFRICSARTAPAWTC